MCKDKRYNNSAKGRFREYERRSRKKELPFTLSFAQVFKMLTAKCHYCLAEPKEFQGIDRRDNNKGYTNKNTVGCCSQCNYAKRMMPEKEFKAFLARITLSQIIKRPALRKQVIKLLKELH